MVISKEHDEGRIPFYWDDEVLGVKPSKETLGSFNDRDTILKDGNGGWVVQFTDNNEVCYLQTAAFLALEAGYMNIADYLLGNLEEPEVQNLLQTKEAREILKAEFDYLTISLRQLFTHSELRDSESFTAYLETERLKLALIEEETALEYTRSQLETHKSDYEFLLAQKKGNGASSKKLVRIDTQGRPNQFGHWVYVDTPNGKGLVH